MKISKQTRTDGPLFSDNEKLIIALIIKEYSTGDIAEELNLSANTIKSHRRRIMQKLGARSVAGIVREVIVHDLLSMDYMSSNKL